MNSKTPSVLTILLMKGWSIIPPIVSILNYYRKVTFSWGELFELMLHSAKVIRIFYRQRKDINNFLQSNQSVSRTNYFRILMLASIDVALTLPVGIVNVILYCLVYAETSGPKEFYPGWHEVHSDWAPRSKTYAELQADRTSVALQYFIHWVTPMLAFAIFGLFGCSAEARVSYRRMFYVLAGFFGWRPTLRLQRSQSATLDSMDFGERHLGFVSFTTESRYVSLLPSWIKLSTSHKFRPPSFIYNPHSETVVESSIEDSRYSHSQNTCPSYKQIDCVDLKGLRLPDPVYSLP